MTRVSGPVFRWGRRPSPFEVVDGVAIRPGASAHVQIGAARDMLRAAPSGSLIVGALPFDLSSPGRLWIGRPRSMSLPNFRSLRHRTEPSRTDDSEHRSAFTSSVRSVLRGISDGTLQKVVLARTDVITRPEDFDEAEVFARLSSDRSSVAFQVHGSESQGDFLGASPEVLVRVNGARLVSTPFAGSVPRGGVSRTRARNELIRSAKVGTEHGLVIDDIVGRLRGVAMADVDVVGPELRSTERVWHLASAITTTVDRAHIDSLAAVELLHPTPAVCGVPRTAALRVISESEPFERGLFGGVVGWQSRDGDGEWRVSIRCGLVTGPSARLFAGAGIVRGSDADAEYDETTAKMRTMNDALAAAGKTGALAPLMQTDETRTQEGDARWTT